MQPFEPTHTDHRLPVALRHEADAAPDFRSSTLQPDPDDPIAWRRRPQTPAASRPGWLVPALLATVLLLTVAAAGWAWYAG